MVSAGKFERRGSRALFREEFRERIEVTRIHSVSGLTGQGTGLAHERPFRAPHASATYAALVGGKLSPDVFRGAEALRRAQLAQVEAERRFGLQQPATWANFIFSGVL